MNAGETPEPDDGGRVKLMHEVAAMMDAIEGDYGSDFTIGRVVTIVEIVTPENTELRVRAGQLPWVSLGMLEWAKSAVKAPPAADR